MARRSRPKRPPRFDMMESHADAIAGSMMAEHPMRKRLKADILSALKGIQRSARGPAARGRAKSVFS